MARDARRRRDCMTAFEIEMEWKESCEMRPKWSDKGGKLKKGGKSFIFCECC